MKTKTVAKKMEVMKKMTKFREESEVDNMMVVGSSGLLVHSSSALLFSLNVHY